MYQDDCNFDKGQNITEEGEIQNLEDCVSHCFNMTRCSHFSYNRNSKSCSLKEITSAQLNVYRSDLGVGSGGIFYYIPSRWNIRLSAETNTKITDVSSSGLGLPDRASALISMAVVIIVILIIASIIVFYKY